MVVREQIDDIRFLGGVYQDIENQYNEIDYSQTLADFLPVLEEQHETFFDNEKGPSGSPWPELSPVTVKRKGHDKILYETGRLKASLTGPGTDSIREISDQGDGLLFGTEVPYSIFHQRGGPNLPQREHIGTNDQKLNDLLDNIADHTVEQLKIQL